MYGSTDEIQALREELKASQAEVVRCTRNWKYSQQGKEEAQRRKKELEMAFRDLQLDNEIRASMID